MHHFFQGLFGALLALSAPAESQTCTPPATWPAPQDFGAGVQRYADISYWEGSSAKLDVYLPVGWQGGFQGPTIMFVHGGGGTAGDKHDPGIRLFLRRLAQAGFPVVSINYALAGTDCATPAYPQAILDVRAAVAWVRRDDLVGPSGADVCLPSCLAMVGTSAGAYLASMAGTLWQANDGGLFDCRIPGADYRVDFVVGVSGAYDLAGLGRDGYCAETVCDTAQGCDFPLDDLCDTRPGWPVDYPALTSQEWGSLAFGNTLPNGCWPFENFLGCQWGADCAPIGPPPLPRQPSGNPFYDGSPLHWVGGGDAAFHLLHSQCDTILPHGQSQVFHDALLAAGGDATLSTLNGCGHGLRAGSAGLVSTENAALEVQDAIAAWLARGGCTPSTELPFGCGLSPAGSLTLIEGAAFPGARLTFALDDPTGTMAPGSWPLFLAAWQAHPNYPCGDVLPSLGLGGPGEGLIDSTAILGATSGLPWLGPGNPVELHFDLPASRSLVGFAVYFQGLLIDPAAGGGNGAQRIGLTQGVEVRLGL